MTPISDFRHERCALEDRFTEVLASTIARRRIERKSLIQIGSMLVTPAFFGDEEDYIDVIEARSFAREAYAFLKMAGWRLVRRPTWFFRHREPELVANVIAYGLAYWHIGWHADRIDLGHAESCGFECYDGRFVQVADRLLISLWARRITFVRE